jgi:hypothetical protein
MSVVSEMKKAFQFMVCGEFGERRKFTDATGETVRQIEFHVFGRTFVLNAETESDFMAFPKPGVEARSIGQLRRKRDSLAVKAAIRNWVTPESPDWKPFSDEEILAGVLYGGWGKVVQKKTTTFGGTDYRNLQVATFGDTFLFREFRDDAIFEHCPDSGIVYIGGHLDILVVSAKEGKMTDLFPIVDNYKVDSSASTSAVPPASAPARSTLREAKTA